MAETTRSQSEEVKVGFHPNISELSAADWNQLAGDSYPFIRYEFLAALESSGAVGPGTGWQPFHVSIVDSNGDYLALMPLYLKTDSWGEFVFDFSWANAYAEHGRNYYPKLVNSIPFTPTTGPRLLVREEVNRAAITKLIAQAIRQVAAEVGASSVHSLFFSDHQLDHWLGAGFVRRTGCQFHWYNRGYNNYEDFLADFTSKRRRAHKRDRHRIVQQGIQLRRCRGDEMDDLDWQNLYQFYRITFERKSGYVPFPLILFDHLRQTMPKSILGVFADFEGETIAGALFVIGKDCLYGRYWGATAHKDCLHFEVCYHQGIEFCIEQGLSRFEPGAQGEFKILRGFTPVLTWSAHMILDPGFSAAIEDFLVREDRHIRAYRQAQMELLPFRDGVEPIPLK